MIQMILCVGIPSPVRNLNSTEVDHCMLKCTWTAPDTLQGIPILKYNFNIARHSDGAVLGSNTTTTTEFLYTVTKLGEILEVVVAAENEVGPCNGSSKTVTSPTSGNLAIQKLSL